MSLVTRCTACGTLFKVVADQLKISDGWVRCGQCAQVFDAQANLVISGAPATLAAQDPQLPAATAVAPTDAAQHSTVATKSIAPSAYSMPARDPKHLEKSVSVADLALLHDWQPRASPFAQPTPSVSQPPSDSLISMATDSRAFKPGLLRDSQEIDSEAGPSSASWASSDYALQNPGAVSIPPDSPSSRSSSRSAEPTSLNASGDSTSQPSSLLPSEPADLASARATAAAPNTSLLTQPTTRPTLQPMPSFVKQAQRAARWRSPWMRLGLAVFALFLLAALALQVALHDKDRLAATHPQFKPWLDQLCQQAGCNVEPLRRIEAIVIDSSSFNRINKSNLQLEASLQSYKLGITLKNTGTLPVATPHIELSLQDAQDQPILRRVLSPADVGSALERLMPAQELAGSVTLQVTAAQLAGSRINGYRVLAFYP